MKTCIRLASILLSTFVALSCSGQKKEIVISGNLTNLPDGKMALYTRSRKTGKIIPIDTVQTRNGQFAFHLDRQIYPEPIDAYLEHIQDKTDTIRCFQFQTNQTYNGHSISTERIMLEDGIQINGLLKPYTINPKHMIRINTVNNYINNDVDRPIIIGRQTSAYYNDTLGFNPLVGPGRLTNVEQIKNLVKQHPYSYYYLYALEKRVSDFSNPAFMTVFNSFDADVQKSQTGKTLLTYVNNRGAKHLTFATTLVDEQGKVKTILNKKARYNLVVLWASWCGPCRQEIPNLKQLHTDLADKGLHMVSVSVDEDKGAWLRAMQKEEMPWPQLLMTPEVATYARELFQFDNSIPTMLLVDSEGRVVKKIVGYEAGNLADIEAVVSSR